MSTTTQYPLVIAKTAKNTIKTDIKVSAEDIEKALLSAVRGSGRAYIAKTTLITAIVDKIKDRLGGRIRKNIRKCLSNNDGINMNEWGIAKDSRLAKAIIRAVNKYLKD